MRIQFKILLFVFKALNEHAPSYISDHIHLYSTLKSLRLANKALVHVPRSRLKLKGDRAFAVAAPHLWNQFPPDIRSTSLFIFMSRLKTHFTLSHVQAINSVCTDVLDIIILLLFLCVCAVLVMFSTLVSVMLNLNVADK